MEAEMTSGRHQTVGVKVGKVQVGGGAPIVVQSMTNTDTADVASTTKQCLELAQAGSELVRITVNMPEAAAAVPEIKKRLLQAGCDVPIIGDFHYNGHVLLTKYPDCARDLDKYRINPGNVGHGQRRDEQFSTICKIARDNGKPVRIGVNGGSLNQELVMRKMQENTDRELGKTSEEIINECMVLSALESTELAAQRPDHYFLQGLPPARSRRYLSRLGATNGPTPSFGAYRSGDGRERARLVGSVDGDFAWRRYRGHGARFPHTPPEW
jgi:(E)-4-hydroxy-3-methylbut-2-enyl-diphosphate synthase